MHVTRSLAGAFPATLDLLLTPFVLLVAGDGCTAADFLREILAPIDSELLSFEMDRRLELRDLSRFDAAVRADVGLVPVLIDGIVNLSCLVGVSTKV